MRIIIALLLYVCPVLGFCVLPPCEFYSLGEDDRINVLRKCWEYRDEIIEEIEIEGYEDAQEVFFHVYHQMLILDSELSKIHPILLQEKEREFKD